MDDKTDDQGFKYDFLMEEAMRTVVHKVLTETLERGLPGNHHFYVSFRTGAEGVEIANRLKLQYPEEMTIVIQHQYWNLHIHDLAFEIELAFSGKRERLFIPFAALTGFVDPEAQFGLKFGADATAKELPNLKKAAAKDNTAEDNTPKDAAKDGEKVVSLDRFRNK
ncbi:MAG: hypothetical protein ACI82H_000880 [Alphaproteobacteria bacterium]|jgi:hypothetical protein